MNAIDPSGHKIKVLGGTAEEKKEYRRAKKYLKGSSKGKKLIQKIEKWSKEVTIQFVGPSEKSEYKHKSKKKFWYYRGGLATGKNDFVMSAAMMLAHEFGHVAQHIDGELDDYIKKDTVSSLLDAEEVNVKKYETPIAKQLGEPYRRTYMDNKGRGIMNNALHFRTKHPGVHHGWLTPNIIEHNWAPLLGTTITAKKK